jgi:hypothetical protein
MRESRIEEEEMTCKREPIFKRKTELNGFPGIAAGEIQVVPILEEIRGLPLG